ncbi:hypothetical protein OEJ37_30070 [Burkholderia sp. BKH01]|uniref:hypothetical protein n=1 Tax=Burkholderia sp. BKH01 TaxID=2769262 RepID=UPI0021DF7282|nr:hypothetical protein [Burkholderia sp. BKH01]MCU9957612.1 hypothetical protein [Burkholderia sp. BKH01]
MSVEAVAHLLLTGLIGPAIAWNRSHHASDPLSNSACMAMVQIDDELVRGRVWTFTGVA